MLSIEVLREQSESANNGSTTCRASDEGSAAGTSIEYEPSHRSDRNILL